jgi:ClpP class serine protease
MRHILNEIESMRWAITKPALEAIWRLASREWTAADYEVFHLAAEEEKQALVATLGEPVDGSSGAFIQGDTGILMIDGPIIPRADSWDASSGLVGINGLTEDFKMFEADARVKRIVGLFDSPGGNVTSISEFSDLVRSSSKDTIAFVYGSAASAAYWIATGFDRVVGSNTSLVGSIGTVAVFRKNKDKDDEIEMVSDQSPDKRPDLETEAGRENIQTVLNELADVFIGAVARNMGVTTKKVLKDFGQGGELVAARALSVGMIDEISTLDKLMSSFNQPNPAVGGERRSLMNKTYSELMAEHPAAFAEHEREKVADKAKAEEAKLKEKRDADIEAAAKFLGTEYSKNIQGLAAQVIKGELDLVALNCAVAAHDEHAEEIKSLKAKIETMEVGGTASGNSSGMSEMQKEIAEDNLTRTVVLGMKPLTPTEA